MASSVATPLEKQFSTIAGIDSMTSTNSLGQTNITIQFNLSRSLDGAALDVQAAITAAGGQLPPEMPTPPTFQKVNPADSPILYLALSSPTMKLSDVDEAAETTIAQNISMVNGVAQVQVYGSQKYAMRVQLDPSALASRQIGIDEVSAALQSGNTNLPTGTLYGQNHTFTILSNGQRMNAQQFGPMVVAYRNGSPVRLNELGRVIDSVQNDKTASWFNGNRAIVLAIQKQPGTNTVAVVDSIKKLLPRLEEHIPAAVQVDTLYDRSVSIRASVNDVKFTLLLTIGLVVMVIFLFLRNVSATIIPSLALPMSIIGTFSVMYLLGYSLDNLSLMALTLVRRIRRGRRHRDAGEHRPPHGDGKDAAAGRDGWRRRNWLHHSLHDPVAGRGVHSAAVHGRNHRTLAARICGHHRRRHPGVGIRLAHA